MPQTASKSKYNRPLSQEEMNEVWRVARILIISAYLIMVLAAILVSQETIKLYPSSMNVDIVRGYAGRVEYALRYQTLLVAWLVFMIIATIAGRFKYHALNPLNEVSEERVQMHKSILTNSFEQITLSIIAQLIFVSFASPEVILKFIPLINIIQFIGRIAFYIGYPMKRALGFHFSFVPSVVLVVYDLVKFFAFLFNI